MNERNRYSRRQFLKIGSAAAGCGLLGLYQSRAQPAGKSSRPNILWLTSEDNSIFWVSCYGGTNTSTPNLDKLAVRGMLPHNRLGRQMFRKLKVYAGAEHPHTAQQPVELKF